MQRRVLLLAPIIVALAGCGNGINVPPKPQLKLDTTLLDFGQQFDGGTYVGTQPQNSVQIKNLGQQDLQITAVDQAGDPVFIKQGPSRPSGDDPSMDKNLATLHYGQISFITVTFAPKEAKSYKGQLIIHSNAENQPTAQVDLSGFGVSAPPGP